MSLQFYFGGSGSGKSRKLHEDIIEQASMHPRTNYFILVPDQFTMQTQMDLVMEHPNHGIMNIDVLSFGRLAYRVLEEVGENKLPILDDTGKNLILRRIVKKLEGQLPTLGSRLDKMGYIHEVKSILSEFMQYGISPDGVKELAEYADAHGALKSRLLDLEVIYRAFLDYLEERFLTKEERLGLLKRCLHRCAMLQDAVVAFDGFTGFTPLQYQIIQELMALTKEVKMTVILPTKEDPYLLDGEQRLFHLSKKTVHDVQRLAQQISVAEVSPVWVETKQNRFANAPELRHLEAQLLRYPSQAYHEEVGTIHLARANTMSEEVREVCLQIRRLIREEGYQYRDIAVVAGSLDGYANLMEQLFFEYQIPYYMDHTKAIVQSPFIQFVHSAIKVIEQKFSLDGMMKYLRSGFSCLTDEETDYLENYLRKCGIKGKRTWLHPFAKKGKRAEEMEAILEQMNGYRERILTQLAPLLQPVKTAEDAIKNLYQFLVETESQEKLEGLALDFEKAGDMVRAREHRQWYRLLVDLLDQMYMLLGEEEMDYAQFLQILEAGVGELQVGNIPGEVDRVLIGDMERTRLKQVKILFFIGVNDGNIPKGTTKGGLISDMDREFLQQSNYELAPTPRQQMYIQRLYLYMNMTKPSEALYLSYAAMNEGGETLQPSYLIATMKGLFPKLRQKEVGQVELLDQIEIKRDVERLFAHIISKYAAGEVDEEAKGILQTIYLGTAEQSPLDELVSLAFAYYQNTPLARRIASMLYGQILRGSITRFETYASCAYRHFLQYGLALKEREEFTFEAVDLGNIYHQVLEGFSTMLEQKGLTWMDFSTEFVEATIDELLKQATVEYGDTVLYSTARMQHSISYMGRILKRSVMTLQEHLQKGSFIPNRVEMRFEKIECLEDIDLGLSAEEKMILRGRVDRVDLCEEEDRIYVKIIDYKSGDKRFDLAAIYYGLQLQLVTYMNEVCEKTAGQRIGKELVPAALLYYHVTDPLVEEVKPLNMEEINASIRKQLTTRGVVNGDEHVIELLHHELEGRSDVIPVKRNKNGGLDSSSEVLSQEDIQLVSDYVNHKIREIGKQILMGQIGAEPMQQNAGACGYCRYQSVCYQRRLEGYKEREPRLKNDEEILAEMRETLERETGK